MNLERLRKLCLALPGATEQIQWGADLVFKVGGKMFCVACTEVAPNVDVVQVRRRDVCRAVRARGCHPGAVPGARQVGGARTMGRARGPRVRAAGRAGVHARPAAAAEEDAGGTRGAADGTGPRAAQIEAREVEVGKSKPAKSRPIKRKSSRRRPVERGKSCARFVAVVLALAASRLPARAQEPPAGAARRLGADEHQPRGRAVSASGRRTCRSPSKGRTCGWPTWTSRRAARPTARA